MRIVLIMLTLVGLFAIQPQETPHIVIDRLDCSGYTIRIAGGEPDIEYGISLLGSTQYYAWYDFPQPMKSGEPRIFEWPIEWLPCFLDWAICFERGLTLEAQPAKIEWRFGVHLNGTMLSETIADLALPCGYRQYLPFVVKGE